VRTSHEKKVGRNGIADAITEGLALHPAASQRPCDGAGEDEVDGRRHQRRTEDEGDAFRMPPASGSLQFPATLDLVLRHLPHDGDHRLLVRTTWANMMLEEGKYFGLREAPHPFDNHKLAHPLHSHKIVQALLQAYLDEHLTVVTARVRAELESPDEVFYSFVSHPYLSHRLERRPRSTAKASS
jgi:hypothetical protein